MIFLFAKPKIIPVTILLVSVTSAQTNHDSAAIIKSSLNYLEGWYTGDADRMDAALHPDLVKRKIHLLKQTGNNIINQSSKTDMVEYTRAGFGKLKEDEAMDNDIIILDIYKGIACVKAVSKDYVDYLHLGIFNDEWKIINVLWDVNKEKDE